MSQGTAVADRLKQALEGSTYQDVHAFWEAIKGEGVSVTYPTMTRYFSGGIENPPLGFLHKAAKLLGVRSAWLAFNEGPMTEAEARAREALRREVEEQNRKLADAFRREFPAYSHLGEMAQAAIVEVWVRSQVTWVGRSGPSAEAIEIEGAEKVGRLFRAPFDHLGLDPLRMPAIDQYVMLQAQAVLTLLPDPARGQRGAGQATDKNED